MQQKINTRAKIARAKPKAATQAERDSLQLLDQLCLNGGEDYIEDLLEQYCTSRTETGDRDERRSHRALVRAGLVGFEI